MLVSKESSDESVNEAERHSDFWIFGGIYRPVYLEAHPAEYVERVAIDARHDGAFRMDVHLKHIAAAGVVTAQIETTDGQPAGAPFSAPVAAGADERHARDARRQPADLDRRVPEPLPRRRLSRARRQDRPHHHRALRLPHAWSCAPGTAST